MKKTKFIEEKKCIAVKLPVNLAIKIDEIIKKQGLSKNVLLIDFIKKGLKSLEVE